MIEDRPAKIGAAGLGLGERGPFQISAWKFRELQIGQGEIGIFEIGPGEIGGFEHGAHQPHRLVPHIGGKVRANEFGITQTGAGQIGGDAGAGKIGAVAFRLLHLACEKMGFPQARAGKIRRDGPDLIEHGAVELRAREVCLVHPSGAEIHVGKIKPGQIEPIEAFAGEIHAGGRRLEACLDLRPRHPGRGKHRVRKIDVAHHVLRASGLREQAGRRGEHPSSEALH